MIIIHGDCRVAMDDMPPGSVDAIVTDPPYEIGFMGRDWDQAGVAFNRATWRRALRVIKPGGHLLAFGATRTYHRMTCAIEDAGWEIRDSLHWMYGTGFPKSENVQTAIAARDGSTGERWAGWGTGLKPAHEPIVLARSPFDGTVARNVMMHGTGALNVDRSRIMTDEQLGRFNHARTRGSSYVVQREDGFISNSDGLGRWPANVILDERAAAELDEQSGQSTSPPIGSTAKLQRPQSKHTVSLPPKELPNGYGDSGGASRFFYVAKASPADRAHGLPRGEENPHPTVKPITLMRYLIRLVTPPGGTVLDPFAGSGTCGVAAKLEGMEYIGIELDAEYADLARRRIEGTM